MILSFMRYKDSIIFSNTKYFDVFFKKKIYEYSKAPFRAIFNSIILNNAK